MLARWWENCGACQVVGEDGGGACQVVEDVLARWSVRMVVLARWWVRTVVLAKWCLWSVRIPGLVVARMPVLARWWWCLPGGR